MVTIKRLVQQIARIRFGCVVRFASAPRAALPVPAAGEDRFSVLGKVSPVVRDVARAAKMKNLRPVSSPFEILSAISRPQAKLPMRSLRILGAQFAVLEGIDDALVTGYEHLIPGLVLPDENDSHLLPAAKH
jgi:hypothetical protein